MSLDKVKKRLKHGLEGNIQSGLTSFFFFFFFYKFILETWMSRRVSFFIGILSEVGDKFLQNYSQVCPYL